MGDQQFVTPTEKNMKNLFVAPVLAVAFFLATIINCSADERFSRTADGVITDSQTNLQWLPGPDRDTSYYEAERWVPAQTVAGGGWRLPTREELRTLYDSSFGENKNISPLIFKTSGDYLWVWVEVRAGARSSPFPFYSGIEFGRYSDHSKDKQALAVYGDLSDSKRVFAVRPRR